MEGPKTGGGAVVPRLARLSLLPFFLYFLSFCCPSQGRTRFILLLETTPALQEVWVRGQGDELLIASLWRFGEDGCVNTEKNKPFEMILRGVAKLRAVTLRGILHWGGSQKQAGFVGFNFCTFGIEFIAALVAKTAGKTPHRIRGCPDT